MSAFASLVSLSQTTHKFLSEGFASFCFDLEIYASYHHHVQVERLHEYVIFLEAFLEDYTDELPNNLEGRIGDLANQAEDVLETFISMEIQSILTRLCGRTAVRVRFDYVTLDLLSGKITEELGSIVEEVMKMKQSAGAKDAMQFSDFSIATSSSLLAPTSKDSSMVGFDVDLMVIKTRLAGGSPKLQLIPIVGMGGIGKTTLAKSVFYDQYTIEHFDVRGWVTVAQDCCKQKILSSLWFSINGFDDGCQQGNELKIKQSLKDKRYLIVLDDVWNTKVWDYVRMMFPNDNNGSRIILTSRLYNVAAYTDSSSPLHEMCFMDADQSWDLLKQKVFARENCPPELESIGKKIATSCRGLPLAIVLVAGLLGTTSRSRATWEKIASNVNAAVTNTNDVQCAKILSLSYIHLPRPLRPCFLYMGLFPEDYEIHASKLIRLWVAEKFLKPSENKILEEVAEEYLEDLVKRSLVLVTKRKSNGKIKSCSVHDLVRDLMIRKAEEDKFLLTCRMTSMDIPHCIKNGRHMSIDAKQNRSNCVSPSIDCFGLCCVANLYGSTTHTIIYFHNNSTKPPFCLGCFRLLRVLDFMRWDNVCLLASLPVEVWELFHLRYLAIDYPLINIPAKIALLQNLQTLTIHPSSRYASSIVFLPPEIWRIPQLRHIVSCPFHLPPIPEEVLLVPSSMQTLSEVVNLVFSEKIVKMIPNLKKLGISFVSNVGIEDYQLENLVCLQQLEKLRIRVHRNFRGNLHPVFPTSLKKLVLSGKCGFSWKYVDKIIGSLPKLEVLKLRDDAGDLETWETKEGEFLELKFLSIESSVLRQWITKSNNFPSLKHLQIRNCPRLIELPDCIGKIHTLELIEVNIWNKSLRESAERIKEDRFENYGADDLQVKHVVFLPRAETHIG